MKTRIYYGRDLIGRFNCEGRNVTRLQYFFLKTRWYAKRVALVIVAMDVIGWASVAGYHYAKSTIAPETIEAQVRVEVPVTTFPPMLTKICKAESGLKQFKANGDVLRGKVEPSDIGYCQINETIWNDQARKLGYDIYTEQGNKDMALYIFSNYGDAPWNSSKGIWSK